MNYTLGKWRRWMEDKKTRVREISAQKKTKAQRLGIKSSHFMICHDMSWYIIDKRHLLSWNVTKYHHMSWNVTMLNWKMSSNVMKCIEFPVWTECQNTGGGQNRRTRREVLPVADKFILLHTKVPFIDYFSHFFTIFL